MTKYDSVVIGGGTAGMTAAIALARMGDRVALLEAATELGPTIQGFVRAGCYFDTAVHYIGEMGRGHVLDTYFRFLGLRGLIPDRPLPRNGFLGLRSPDLDQDFLLGWGQDHLRQGLMSLSPRPSPESVDGLLASFDDYWRQSPYLNPDQDLAADNGLFSFERNSAANFLAQRTSDPRLRTILSYPAILIGVRPEKAPIDTHAQVLNSYLRSAHYIQGGGARLAAAFAWGLKGQGVEVFTSSPAARVDLGADGKVAAVQTADGRSFETRNCVYTGSPIQLPGLLGHRGLRSKQSQRLSGLKESISGFVLHAKFKGQPKDFPACPNWLLIRRKGWLQFDGLEQKDGPDGVHISLSQEPNGPLGLSIIAPCSFRAFGAWSSSVSGRRPAAYYDLKDRLQEKLLGLLDREFPELNGRLQPLETSTPLTFRDYCRNPYGGLYGVRHHIDQYPTLPVNKVKGLVLAGQGVIAPGILGAVISGIVATAMIKGRKQTLNLIRQAQCKES